MSSNNLSATFLGFLSDQSLHSAAPAAAGPNPLSFLLDVEENKGVLEKDKGEEKREESKTGEGKNRERPRWEVVFDENSGSPTDTQ